MAMNVTRAFKDYGWCSRIRGVKSGGLVTELPTYVYPSEGATEMACPTELSMGDRREKALADAGFMPLEHIIGTGNAVFKGAQSAQLPKKFGTKTEVEKTATENAALGARLPYLLAASRFAHYLKCMVRDWVGTFKEADELRSELQNWINRYVLANPSTANEQDKALQPLAEASVEVEPIAGDPGAYSAVFRIRPHYQLEKVDVQLSLVSRLKKK